MKRHRIAVLTIITAAALGLLAACGQQQAEQEGLVEDLSDLMPAEPAVPDSAQAAPEHTEIVFADEYVAVTSLALAPGESVPPHEGGERVFYAISAGSLEIGPEDEALTVEVEPGQVVVLEPGTYALDNVGDTAVEGIVVARTAVPLPEILEQPRAVPAPAGRTLFESELLRVRELELEPALGFELEPVPLRVVYAPETVVLEYTNAEGEAAAVETERLGVHVRTGGDRSVINTAAEPAQVVVFEFFR